jgi:cytochrome c biogenesis protein CcmG, thiol:disulfide interchange protein DsbE
MRFPQFFPVAICCGALLCAGSLTAQAPGGGLLHRSAPEFIRADISGRSIDLKGYRGKVVLLNFWATWCASCQLELPSFAQWQLEYGPKGLQVLAASMDDDAAPVRATVLRLHLNFPVVMGDAALGTLYGGVLGLPVTYLIDRDGKISYEFKGEADLGVIRARIEQLLAEQP